MDLYFLEDFTMFMHLCKYNKLLKTSLARHTYVIYQAF